MRRESSAVARLNGGRASQGRNKIEKWTERLLVNVTVQSSFGLRGGIEEFRLAGELARRIYGLGNMKFTHQHNAPRSGNGAWKFKLNSNGVISELIGCAERRYDGQTAVKNGGK
jgi:hypothetical protein